MSYTFLKIIPITPSYIPDESAKIDCSSLLSTLYESNQIVLTQTDEIEFIDQGSNFEGVFCPICNQEISIDHWQEKMEEAYRQQFSNLDLVSPCCGSVTSLNSLNYKLPAGFAKFCIRILNPAIELASDDLQKLQTILKTPLRLIWAHY